MSYVIHHAIIVTGDTYPRVGGLSKIEDLRLKCVEIAAQMKDLQDQPPFNVSNVIGSPVNGVGTFMIAPDGSKEGWFASDRADHARKQVKDLLRESGYVDWVEIRYGQPDWRENLPRYAEVTEARGYIVNDVDDEEVRLPNTFEGTYVPVAKEKA